MIGIKKTKYNSSMMDAAPLEKSEDFGKLLET